MYNCAVKDKIQFSKCGDFHPRNEFEQAVFKWQILKLSWKSIGGPNEVNVELFWPHSTIRTFSSLKLILVLLFCSAIVLTRYKQNATSIIVDISLCYIACHIFIIMLCISYVIFCKVKYTNILRCRNLPSRDIVQLMDGCIIFKSIYIDILSSSK